MEDTIELEKEEMIYNVLSIGEVVEGEEAAATITGKEPNQILNLVLPRSKDDNKNYETQVTNKPRINDVELIGNKTLEDLGIQPQGNYANVNDVYSKEEMYSKEEIDTNTNNLNNALNKSISDNKLMTYTVTLQLANWILNETTTRYEYNVSNPKIKANHYVTINPASIEDEEKFTGKGSVDSYDGGFIITSTELPESDIMISITYQLAHSEVTE